MKTFAETLWAFQKLYALVFDGLVSQSRRDRATLSGEAWRKTSFGIAYAYTGSLGVVLSLPREELILDEEDHDNAMTTVVEMARARSSDQIKHFADQFGAAPIRALNEWADSHFSNRTGVVLGWRDRKEELFLGQESFGELIKAISETGDETEESLTVLGDLVGANTRRHTFEMEVVADGRLMQGYMSESIGEEHTVELPRRYKAVILQRRRVNYATGEQELTFRLQELQPQD